MNKIDIVSTGNWEVMYVNGEMVVEGHSLSANDFLYVINKYKNFSKSDSYYIDSDIVEEELNCDFPDNFYDIPNEYLEEE